MNNYNIFKKTAFVFVSLLLVGCANQLSSTDAKAGQTAGSVSTKTVSLGGNGNVSDMTNTSVMANASNQTYYFDFDQSQLHSADQIALNKQANYLIAHQHARLRIEGNTDDRGSREYNVALGWRRAKTVAQQLRQDGVGAKQFYLVSYGAEKPAVVGYTDQDYQLNRRVNLIYEAK